MKKRLFLLCSLAALLAFAGCKKETDEKPNDNGSTPAADIAANRFSVEEGRQVRIALGNLQYQASTNTFRIAPNAWDAAKEDNLKASSSFTGWIDLFPWGTSGKDHFMPYDNANSSGNYYHDGDIAGTDYDWGQYNAIQNGNSSDPAGTWRTMTASEWEFLLLHRSASTVEGVADARYLIATVNQQEGIILFPDEFEMPQGVVLTTASAINTPSAYSYNRLNADEWGKLQQAGCVFIPAIGCKNISNNTLVSSDFLGCYWAATLYGYGDMGYTAYQVWFNPNMCELGSAGLQYPRAVRLVKDIQ